MMRRTKPKTTKTQASIAAIGDTITYAEGKNEYSGKLIRILRNGDFVVRGKDRTARVPCSQIIKHQPPAQEIRWWPIGRFDPKIAEICMKKLRDAGFKVSMTEMSFQGKVWGQPNIYGTRFHLSEADRIWHQFQQKT